MAFQEPNLRRGEQRMQLIPNHLQCRLFHRQFSPYNSIRNVQKLADSLQPEEAQEFSEPCDHMQGLSQTNESHVAEHPRNWPIQKKGRESRVPLRLY